MPDTWKRFITPALVALGVLLMVMWGVAMLPTPTGTAPLAAVATAPSLPIASVTGNPSLSEALSAAPMCFEGNCPMTAEDLKIIGEFLAPTGHWIVSNWMLVTALLLIAIACIRKYNQFRSDNPEQESAQPRQVVVGGKTLQLPTLRCKQAKLILPNDPRFAGLTFDSIIGQVEAKADITEVLEFLQHPEKFQKMEAELPRGVLLYGASGTGKTLLVRTLAALCGLPVLEIAGSRFVEVYVGTGSSRVAALYEDADALAKIFGACLIFMDEFDAVGRARSGSGQGNSEGENTLNQLLSEMDGIVQRPRVLTFAATNRRDILDPAVLRPGRFDRQIEFFNPNKKDREEILALYLPAHLMGLDVDFARAAKVTPSASGAHLKNIANEAKIMAARQDRDTVTASILDEAVQKVLHGARRDAQRSVLNAVEIDTLKVHESGHAFLYWKRTGKAPLRFTIIPRGQSGGHVEFHEDFELLRTREHLETRLVVLMGGWAATYIERDRQEDTGIGADYQMATKLAVDMVAVHGMSPLGPINLQVLSDAGLLSDEFQARVIAEVEGKLSWAKQEAFRLISEGRAELKRLIDAVGEHETLLEAQFEALFITPDRQDATVLPFRRPIQPPPMFHPQPVNGRAAFNIRIPLPAFALKLPWRRQKQQREENAQAG